MHNELARGILGNLQRLGRRMENAMKTRNDHDRFVAALFARRLDVIRDDLIELANRMAVNHGKADATTVNTVLAMLGEDADELPEANRARLRELAAE